MKLPPLPANEEARLKALEEYAVLDSLPENDFDEITSLASEICETPISLITLLDQERQWFKSHHGLNTTETPRPYAFCAYAINEPDRMMVVQDSRKDERFQNNPLVVGNPHVIFYAGVPLLTPAGFPLGTLCVIDNKPRALSDLQQRTLQVLANQVMKLLELRKRNVDLIKLQGELNRQNEELKEFTYFASHDLREPLRMITSFLGLLKNDYKKHLDARALSYIDFAVDGAQRMTKLILDLLTLSSLDKEKLRRELLSLSEIIGLVQRNLHQQIRENNAIITIENELPSFPANASEMSSLFQNIISNAIKFRKKEDPPVIKISCVEESGFWKIQIQDNGIGIAFDHQEVVFEKFKKLHGVSEYSGSGLGLAICKKIVENYGGTISIDSRVGEGASIFISLPKS